MQLNRNIDHWAEQTPNSAAFKFGEDTISFQKLAAQAKRAADVLYDKFNIRFGDRVSYLGFNHPDMVVTLLACEQIGAVFNPLNNRLAPAEYAFLIADAGPKLCLTEPQFFDMLEALPEAQGRIVLTGELQLHGSTPHASLVPPSPHSPQRQIDPTEPLLLVYTSGTTGRPKGVLLSRRAVMVNIENCQQLYNFQPGQRIQITIPLFHVGGLCIMLLPALTHGATILLHAKFDPLATILDFENNRPTSTILVPAQMEAMIHLPQWSTCDLSALAYVVVGSSLIPKHHIEKFHERNIPVSQLYGATETGPAVLGLELESARHKVGSAGTPVKYCDVEIRDKNRRPLSVEEHGDLWVKGENILSGYWQNEAETEAVLIDGWYNTGDIGFVDKDGFYWIVDRSKDVIISGGENIYPAEIEAASREHPDIAAIAVVGQKHAKWGETPVAVIETTSGRELKLKDLQAFLHNKLARFKHPKSVIVVDHLPRNGMGKIEKSVLRQQLNS